MSCNDKHNLVGELSKPKEIQGYSAYELAVIHGFNGTVEEWLESLTENTKLNAAEVIQEANKQIDNMNAASETAKRKITEAETEAVEHIEQMAEEFANIVQTKGNSETAVMSQKAVTEALEISGTDLNAMLNAVMPIEGYTPPEYPEEDEENNGDDGNTTPDDGGDDNTGGGNTNPDEGGEDNSSTENGNAGEVTIISHLSEPIKVKFALEDYTPGDGFGVATIEPYGQYTIRPCTSYHVAVEIYTESGNGIIKSVTSSAFAPTYFTSYGFKFYPDDTGKAETITLFETNYGTYKPNDGDSGSTE